MKVVTRFAPSPTGYFHAGSYRTALFSWIFAKQNGGKFILRIEDTDKERSKKEFEDNIIDSLKWLGLDYDEFYRQSDRTDIYKKYIRQLIDTNKAYLSHEADRRVAPDTSRSAPYQRDAIGARSEGVGGESGDRLAARDTVIRFKNPNKKVIFEDSIRGKIKFDTTELGDFVIAKSEDEPVFHMVNVVDDYEMGMTHIIRGEDHISNTPRQILIYEALGVKPPLFAHIPLLLAKDRSKLSKRNGAVPVTEYRSRGYLPEAVVNYLALLGWHPADEREVLTLEEIVKEFTLERVQKSGAIFDEDKLKWFNRQYLVKIGDDEFAKRAVQFLPEWISTDSDVFKRSLPLIRDKVQAFDETAQLFGKGGELAFVRGVNETAGALEYSKEMLLWKKNPDPKTALTHLNKVKELLAGLSDDQFSAEKIKNILWDYAEKNGKGDVLWPLRVALTGQEKSPDPFTCAFILGKKETLTRIEKAGGRLNEK